jgi:succinyl-CoA synthetase beta subunit
MRFYEYEAKALFRRHGLPLGSGEVVESAEAARSAFGRIDGPAVL